MGNNIFEIIKGGGGGAGVKNCSHSKNVNGVSNFGDVFQAILTKSKKIF